MKYLARRAEAAAAQAEQTQEDREFTAARRYDPTMPKTRAKRVSRRDTPVDAFAKSLARQLGTRTGRAIMRGVLGGLFKGR